MNEQQRRTALTPQDVDERIYAVVSKIPRGKVTTYGDVAQRAGLPRGARRVGRALRVLPSNRNLPWHRVVNAQGCIALPPQTASASKQRQRLQREGVVFIADRIDLQRYGWRLTLDEILWGPASFASGPPVHEPGKSRVRRSKRRSPRNASDSEPG